MGYNTNLLFMLTVVGEFLKWEQFYYSIQGLKTHPLVQLEAHTIFDFLRGIGGIFFIFYITWWLSTRWTYIKNELKIVIKIFFWTIGYVMGVRTLTRISRKYFTGLCMPEIIAWLISTAMLHLFLYVDSSPLHGLMFILSLLYVGLTHIRYSHFGYKDHLDLAYLYASLVCIHFFYFTVKVLGRKRHLPQVSAKPTSWYRSL